MAKRSTEEVKMNMTPMIDIVFQLIIFFVVSTQLDKQVFDQRIRLAMAPDGPAIEKRDPRTVVVEVNKNGVISIARTRLTLNKLRSILKQVVIQSGSAVPVQIRADRATIHENVRRVMEACGEAGIWKVSFVATREKAKH